MTDHLDHQPEVLHLCFLPPEAAGSFNRTLGSFLSSDHAVGHRMLSAGPPPLHRSEGGRLRYTSGRTSPSIVRAVRRRSTRDPVRRYAIHEDPARAAYASEVEGHIRNLMPDVVVVYDDVKLGLRLARSRRGAHHRLVFSQHGEGYQLEPDVARAFYGRGGFDAVMVLSTGIRRAILEVCPSAADIVVHPNSVDTERFKPLGSSEVEQLRRRYGLPEAPLMGFVGRLHPSKGAHHAVDALAVARASVPQAQLVIVGGGSAAYVEELRDHIRARGLEDAVTMLGAIDHEDLHHIIPCFDAFVFPSHREGMPLAVLEAMACGVPVAAFEFLSSRDIGGPPEGLALVTPGDSIALAQASTTWLLDAGRRADAGGRARARAVAAFSRSGWCERTAQLFREGHVQPEGGVQTPPPSHRELR